MVPFALLDGAMCESAASICCEQFGAKGKTVQRLAKDWPRTGKGLVKDTVKDFNHHRTAVRVDL